MFSFPPESKLDFIFSLGSFSTHGKVNKHKVMLEFNPHLEEVMSFTQTDDIQLLYQILKKTISSSLVRSRCQHLVTACSPALKQKYDELSSPSFFIEALNILLQQFNYC